jgi:hypothetical protein
MATRSKPRVRHALAAVTTKSGPAATRGKKLRLLKE